jgi:hypothetical protein
MGDGALRQTNTVMKLHRRSMLQTVHLLPVIPERKAKLKL